MRRDCLCLTVSISARALSLSADLAPLWVCVSPITHRDPSPLSLTSEDGREGGRREPPDR